jgi:hypothetical protein
MVNYEWYGRLPTTRLCESIRDYVKQDNKLNECLKGQINSYSKDDYETRSLPALNIHPVRTTTKGKYWYHIDTIYFDFYIPASTSRENTLMVARVLAQAFELLLLNTNFNNWIISQNPGVIEFGASTAGYTIDYKSLISNANRDVNLIRFEAFAKLDWLAYNQWLGENGLSELDPSQIIYDTLTSVGVGVEPIPTIQE